MGSLPSHAELNSSRFFVPRLLEEIRFTEEMKSPMNRIASPEESVSEYKRRHTENSEVSCTLRIIYELLFHLADSNQCVDVRHLEPLPKCCQFVLRIAAFCVDKVEC